MFACLNTALDRTVEVSRLTPGTVHVAHAEAEAAGGKGMNAARVAGRLGLRTRVVAFAGGVAGDRVRDLAAAEGIPVEWVATAGETRTCTVIVDREHGATVVNGRGPAVTGGELAAFEARVLTLAAPGRVLALAGSLPPGVDRGVYARWIDRWREAGGGVTAVDAAGDVLVAAVAAAPSVVKVNASEFAALCAGRAEAAVAQGLLERGVAAVVVTRGARGSTAYTRGQAWRVAAGDGPVVNATGAGDAFFAGLLTGWSRDLPVRHRLALAAAAAARSVAAARPAAVDLAGVDGRAALGAVEPVDAGGPA